MSKYPLYTIGYEGVTIGAVTRTLKAHGVKTLLDVRAVPLSRKVGFSKNKLAAALAEQGINYVSLKGLGTPPDGRAAARKGQKRELDRIYGVHLKTEDAKRDLAEANRVADQVPACLLCYEHSPNCCHRLIVAEAMIKTTHQEVIHLDPGLEEFL